jgi:hypothetical protein
MVGGRVTVGPTVRGTEAVTWRAGHLEYCSKGHTFTKAVQGTGITDKQIVTQSLLSPMTR